MNLGRRIQPIASSYLIGAPRGGDIFNHVTLHSDFINKLPVTKFSGLGLERKRNLREAASPATHKSAKKSIVIGITPSLVLFSF